MTQDLKDFWERAYVEVKKELKGRYPKTPLARQSLDRHADGTGQTAV